MSDSAVSPGQYSPKGRLEIMLDEFSELHGTVLMGMHRELQTIKQEIQSEVDTRLKETRSGVDSQLDEFLSQYATAEDRLAASVSQAQKLEQELRALVNSAQAYQGDLAALQAKGEALGRQQQVELAEMSARLLREFSQKGKQEVDRLIEEGRGMLDSNKDDLIQMQLDSSRKMDARQEITKSLLGEAREANKENIALLEALRKDQASHAAEVNRFNRLRFRAMIGLGAALIATVGVWIWLTVTH